MKDLEVLAVFRLSWKCDTEFSGAWEWTLNSLLNYSKMQSLGFRVYFLLTVLLSFPHLLSLTNFLKIAVLSIFFLLLMPNTNFKHRPKTTVEGGCLLGFMLVLGLVAVAAAERGVGISRVTATVGWTKQENGKSCICSSQMFTSALHYRFFCASLLVLQCFLAC